MDSGSKWNGSNGSSVNARPIRTNFGSVPLGMALFDCSVNGVLHFTWYMLRGAVLPM